jgi:outer membrane lipopolysaccharide assembly protein LptE/RlpB
MLTRRQLLGLGLLTSATTWLAGCGGWYLRGARKTALTGKRFFVTPLPSGYLYNYFVAELSYVGISVVGDRGQADAVVILSHETFDRRTLSVDPSTGKVREIELGLQVQLEVRAGDGSLLLAPEKFTWYQDFVFDEFSVLGTEEVELNSRIQLEKDASRSLALRMETLKFKAAPGDR